MYSGNVGLSQSFALVRHAAQRFASNEDVVFLINGEGAARPEVDQWAAKMPNVITNDFGPASELSDVLGTADVQLILLKRGLAKSSTPSKLYGILSAARPVVASIDENSEISSVIAAADCGLAVGPEDPEAFVEAVAQMVATSRSDLELMGKKGRRFAEGWMTASEQARAYLELFTKLIAKGNHRG